MRHVISDRIADLEAIHDDDVELVSISRPVAQTLVSAGEAILAARTDVDARWMQSSSAVDPAINALTPAVGPAGASAIAGEVTAAVSALESLLGCPEVEVRLHSLRRPMCPRFHADQVDCRLLITLIGPGTEWIENGPDEPEASPGEGEGSEEKPIRTLDTGSWTLLKGGRWDAQFGGVLHRSPPGVHERLLLALDPLPPSSRGALDDPYR